VTSVLGITTRLRDALRKDPERLTAGSAMSDPLGFLFAEEELLAARELAPDTLDNIDLGACNDSPPNGEADRLE